MEMTDQSPSWVGEEIEPEGGDSLDSLCMSRYSWSSRGQRKFSMSCRSGRTRSLQAKTISEFNMVVKQIVFRCELLLSDPFPFFIGIEGMESGGT